MCVSECISISHPFTLFPSPSFITCLSASQFRSEHFSSLLHNCLFYFPTSSPSSLAFFSHLPALSSPFLPFLIPPLLSFTSSLPSCHPLSFSLHPYASLPPLHTTSPCPLSRCSASSLNRQLGSLWRRWILTECSPAGRHWPACAAPSFLSGQSRATLPCTSKSEMSGVICVSSCLMCLHTLTWG